MSRKVQSNQFWMAIEVLSPLMKLGLALKAGLRNYGNESNYQYGIKEGFGRVARILDAHKIPATWTVAALALERAPQIAKFISERGDEAASHGHRWVHQFRMDEEQEFEFIKAAADSIEKSVGTSSSGPLVALLIDRKHSKYIGETGFSVPHG